MKIQFYPQTTELEQSLIAEAKARDVSIEEMINIILNNHFGISQGGLTKAELFTKVESEVKEFILDPANKNIEFSLIQASETFRNLNQFYLGRPTAVRAVIGKRFSQLFGFQEPYLNVHPVILDNGKQKLSTGTRSAVYIIN